ncbi:MAG TPA: DUF2953 domain-containing protein [Methanomicrobiales archaeon]|nr:DUF2953 domain-containing protein [Methanomicrobiales archaeon]
MLLPLALALGGLVLLAILSLYFIPVRTFVAAGWGQGKGYVLFQASWAGIGARVRKEEQEVQIEYLFLGIPILTRAAGDRKAEPPGPPEKTHERPPIFTLLHTFLRLIRPMMGFAARVIRATTFQELRAHLLVGLHDPAATGQLYGCFCALSPLLSSDRLSVRVDPVFDRQVFEGEIRAWLRTDRPLLLLAAMAGLLLDPDVRRGISLLRRTVG